MHRKDRFFTLLYVDHHDAAYAWVGRRKFVAIDESIRIISVEETELEAAERTAQAANPSKAANPILASLGRIEDYKRELSSIHDDDDALEFIENLQLDESAKSDLLEFVVSKSARRTIMPKHFVKVVGDDEELAEALEYPLDLWRVFLHPRQQEIVSLPPNSSRYITGGPGTGKTVCLVHRIRQVLRQHAGDKHVLLITFKEHLPDYIHDMMQKLDINVARVSMSDVSEMNEANVVNVTSSASAIDLEASEVIDWGKNCFVVSDGVLWFHDERPVPIAHMFIDEYQDFSGSALNIIEQLMDVVPFTICADLSQAIYRPPRDKVKDSIALRDANLAELNYCYRLNNHVIYHIKNILRMSHAVGGYAAKRTFQFEVFSQESQVLESLVPAISGPAPTIYAYDSIDDRNLFLQAHSGQLMQRYSDDEVVITTFFPELYKYPGENIGYNTELLPESIQKHYRYVYTLKGLEWKAGIVVLDDVICSLLNLNQILFANRLPEGFRGNGENIKRMYNLLYVAMSRFRDYLCICYPQEYSMILMGMMKSSGSATI